MDAAPPTLRRDRALLRRLLGLARPYRGSMAVGAALLLLQVAATNAMPLLIKKAIDGFLVPAAAQVSAATRLEGLGRLCLALAGLTLGMFLFRVAHAFLMTWVGQCVLRDLRMRVFDKVLALPMRVFDQTRVGRLMTRATSDLDALQEFVRDGMIGLAANLLLLVGAVVFMCWIEWRLALALFTVVPLLAGALHWVNLRTREAQRETRSKVSALNSLMQESLSGLFTLRLFGRRDELLARLGGQSEDLRVARAKVADLGTWHFPILEMSRALAVVILLLACGLRAPTETGSLVAFLYYIRYFFRPLEELAEQAQHLQGGFASAERVFDLLDEPDTLPDPENPKGLTPLRGEIDFDHVSFAYDGKTPVIRDISFHLPPGCHAALVGATGSGKTTLLNLLCRFYDVDAGAVRVDGTDVRELAQRELRRHLGVVQQDPLLFSGTVEDNLRLGRGHLTRGEIVEAARFVNAHPFIEKLPKGYDTDLGEGGHRLSTGQKQLIALARVLLQDPEVLLLMDEATANVDSETEALLQEAMTRVMAGRTCITIAHRLSTVLHADTILVLRNGRLLEQGSHAQLLAMDGYYRTLVDVMRHGMDPEA
jgi:ATP-binding cassette subfamily B multidrug efflux pump